MSRVRTSLLLLTVSLLVSLFASELILRWIAPAALHPIFELRNSVYRHDATLGWFPRPNIDATDSCLRTVKVHTNSLGFRDQERSSSANKRVLLLGDSMVWGLDAEADERFSDLLQQRLPMIDILNMGISGYGTDQEYLLLKRLGTEIRPNLIILIFVHNDHENNSSNMSYGYYKPYFQSVGNDMKLLGTPVPIGYRYALSLLSPLSHYSIFVRGVARMYEHVMAPPKLIFPDPTPLILRKLKSYADELGSTILVGLTQEDLPVQQVLTNIGVRYRNLVEAERYKDCGRHWTPAGHQGVAAILEQEINDYFP